MQAILIANNKTQKGILLFNIYNEKSQNADDEQLYTIERELANIKLNSEQKVIIAEDFNAHHNRATLTPTKVGADHPSDVHHPDDVFLFSPILREITYKIKKSLKFFAR